MPNPTIAVIGATGAQGGGLVEALLQRGRFDVRALTRNPSSEKGNELAARGVEVVQADLSAPETLEPAFAGAHGVFLVTNFWETGAEGEREQALAAIQAAKRAGVQHLIWSTLPNSKELSGGKLAVEHFTGKALIDLEVAAAGFPHYSFVEAPFYYQNLVTVMAPQPLEGGAKGWAVPMDPAARCVHAGDVSELGQVVARAFEQPERVGQGSHFGTAGDTLSWNDMVETLNSQGHDLMVVQVAAEVYDTFFPAAAEMREMCQWFEGYTYYGPDAAAKLALANELYPEGLTPFAQWAAANM